METQIQEIERLNQIEKQKELIAELPEMIKNIDLPDRVLNDLFWAERYRLEHNLPCWFMTIPEIMLVYGSALLEMVDDKNMPWKVDGAVDSIIDDNCRLIDPARSFVHVFVQRQEDLNVDEIKETYPDRISKDDDYLFIYDKDQTPESITVNVEWLD